MLFSVHIGSAAATSCFPLCVDSKARTISLEFCQEHCSCVQKELRPRTFYFGCEMQKYYKSIYVFWNGIVYVWMEIRVFYSFIVERPSSGHSSACLYLL